MAEHRQQNLYMLNIQEKKFKNHMNPSKHWKKKKKKPLKYTPKHRKNKNPSSFNTRIKSFMQNCIRWSEYSYHQILFLYPYNLLLDAYPLSYVWYCWASDR